MKGKIIIGIFAVLMVGYLLLADKFRNSDRFNKVSNAVGYVLLFGFFAVLGITIILQFVMLLRR